jgi:DNA adenine methylase
VNRKGKYNVPFGDKPKPNFPDTSELALVSAALTTSELRTTDFEEALAEVGESDFVYVDPPYPPLNGTSFFTHYTTGRFSGADQHRLANALVEVDRRGGLFLMTNADTPLIRNLYKSFNIEEMDVTRFVSCKGNRYKIGELVITNYI